jgi:hypothetical protein
MIKTINKILDYSKTPFILAAIIFISSLVLLSVFKNAETQLKQLNNAMLVADEMATSSDNLTNYARYYVTTKDDTWKKKFDNVLKVRAGEEPDSNGVRIPFKDKVKQVGFSDSELSLMLQAEKFSNNLAVLEVKAFELVAQGKLEQNWEIQQFHYTQAQMFMFGEDYTKHKNEIMNTIDKFTKAVYTRLEHDYKLSMTLAWILITIINISLIILVISVQHHNKSLASNNLPSNTSKPTIKKKLTSKLRR